MLLTSIDASCSQIYNLFQCKYLNTISAVNNLGRGDVDLEYLREELHADAVILSLLLTNRERTGG